MAYIALIWYSDPESNWTKALSVQKFIKLLARPRANRSLTFQKFVDCSPGLLTDGYVFPLFPGANPQSGQVHFHQGSGGHFKCLYCSGSCGRGSSIGGLLLSKYPTNKT